MFDVDVAAQAELDEDREVNETLKKDQRYYFKIRARKDKNGVRVHVRYWVLYVDEVIITSLISCRRETARRCASHS